MTKNKNEKDQDISRTERKKNAENMQKLGEELVNLSTAKLMSIQLEAELLEAIIIAQGLTSHGAKRRQLQYIGKLMRDIDPEPIKQALDALQTTRTQQSKQFHDIEHWRERLIAGDQTDLYKFIGLHPRCDTQKLRQLIRKAQRDRLQNQNTGFEKKLFRFLKEEMNKRDD